MHIQSHMIIQCNEIRISQVTHRRNWCVQALIHKHIQIVTYIFCVSNSFSRMLFFHVLLPGCSLTRSLYYWKTLETHCMYACATLYLYVCMYLIMYNLMLVAIMNGRIFPLLQENDVFFFKREVIIFYFSTVFLF